MGMTPLTNGADIFLQAFNDPSAKIGQELLLPIKEIIDYNGFAKRLLRTYDMWDPHTIGKWDRWRSWG